MGTARAKAKPPVITAREIAEYIEVSSVLSRAKKRQEKLRPSLLARLEAGAAQEKDSPYELYTEEHDKPGIDWREECTKMYMEYFPEDWESKLLQLDADNRRTEVHLKSRPNPAYLAKVQGL
jgi:hypothetical protein